MQVRSSLLILVQPCVPFWSVRMSLACPGAVRSLLDGGHPAFHTVWSRVRELVSLPGRNLSRVGLCG